MRTRTTDKKYNGLCWITRHHKDDISEPTFTTYFAKIPNGKSHKLVKIASDKDMLSKAELRQRAKDEIEKRSLRGYSDFTLDSFFQNKFLLNRRSLGIKTKEIERIWQKDISKVLGSTKLSDLEISSVQDLFDRLTLGSTERKGSQSVANSVIKILKSVYAFANQTGVVSHNPVANIKKHKETERVAYFNEDQKKRFLKALFSFGKEYKYSTALIYVLYLTGARLGELTSAKWSDLQGNKIVLEDHKTARKTGKARVIYLSAEAMSVINNMPRSNETIFKIKDPNTCWKQLRQKADLNEFRLHDLRHNFCSQAINNGFEMIQVGHLVGHKSVKTMQRYQHIMEETSENNIKQIGNLLK